MYNEQKSTESSLIMPGVLLGLFELVFLVLSFGQFNAYIPVGQGRKQGKKREEEE